MPTNVIMPALEMAQETGKVLRWIKSPGDRVVKGESIVEIETDKVTGEIEAPEPHRSPERRRQKMRRINSPTGCRRQSDERRPEENFLQSEQHLELVQN